MKPIVVPQRSRRFAGGISGSETPSSRMSPEGMRQVWSRTPIIALIIVVLPAPLGPVNPIHSPSSMEKLTPRSNWAWPFPSTYRFLISSISAVLLFQFLAQNIEGQRAQEDKQNRIKQEHGSHSQVAAGRRKHRAPVDHIIPQGQANKRETGNRHNHLRTG